MAADGPLKEVIYTPEPALRHPAALMRGMIADLRASRELAVRLFIRNFQARYRQSLLGYFWVVVPPVMTAAVWILLHRAEIVSFGRTAVPYSLYVLTGSLLWQGFVDAIQCPLKNITESKAMFVKINFPREAVIVAGIGEVLVNFCIRMILIVLLLAIFRVTMTPATLLAPVGILAIVLLGTAIGIVIAPLGILYKDVSEGLNIILRFWFFLTPVIYNPPTTWPKSLLVDINPISPLLISTRDLLTTGTLTHAGGLIAVSIGSFILILIGWLLYRISLPHMIERMSA